MLCFYSAKGGAGCSVVAASTALLLARSTPTLLVDLAGDLPDILGLPAPDVESDRSPGLAAWVAAAEPGPDALHWMEQPVVGGLSLLGGVAGTATYADPERLVLLASLLASEPRRVVIDCGDHAHLDPVVEHSSRSILVTRPCYVALSRARRRPAPDGIVLVSEPHRALSAADVGAVIDAPLAAVVGYEARVFRTVDAGLLSSRLPRSLHPLEVFV